MTSDADAVRRSWPLLIDAMLDAVVLVEPETLRIVAANGAAGRLHGVDADALVGRDVRDAAPTPEDACFWAEVADGIASDIVSDAWIVRAGGAAVPVTRRVSRVAPAPGCALYVLTLHDRSAAERNERAADLAVAELQATLESVWDAVLVTDRAGHIRHFNRRFAAMWKLPDEMLALRADDAVFDHIRSQLADAAGYMRRLSELEAAGDAESLDRLVLRSGEVIERAATVQRSRGRAIGRVWAFRPLVAEARAAA